MRVLLISPFHGRSSHGAWARGYQRVSRHQFVELTLEDRAWARRLKEAAWNLAPMALAVSEPIDLILATSMTDLSTLFGLVRRSPLARLPTVLYMHENQMTYPVRPEGKREPHLVAIGFKAMLCADHLWFNSEHNRQETLAAIPVCFPTSEDALKEDWLVSLGRKSEVMPVGLELPEVLEPVRPPGRKPIVLWNQRWQWDKAPEVFVEFALELRRKSDFCLVLLGGEPHREPPERRALKEGFGSDLLHCGWCSKEQYWHWLQQSDLTVSVARHEFFGLSILEAVAAGVFPLLPHNLSYPEVLPKTFHRACLYSDFSDLLKRAEKFLTMGPDPSVDLEALRKSPRRFDWRILGRNYDDKLEAIVSPSNY